VEAHIRRLEANDNRSDFDCGVSSMNEWLRKMASQHQQKNIARTYVATLPDDPRKVVGYYALSAFLMETEGMPGKRLPDKVSAVLLARLAVDRNQKGQGLGEYLLGHALDTVVATSEAIGVQCIVVDAIDDNAVRFYRKYGFVPITDTPLRLFLPVATIKQA
jgi:GNAT superfamily N-acetyltransferase